MPHRDKPLKEFRAGSVRASIWQDEVAGKDDEAFSVFRVRVEKRYRGPAGNWQSTTRFKRADLGDLELVVTPDELSLGGTRCSRLSLYKTGGTGDLSEQGVRLE
jgi:hypothetical protein